MISCGHDPESGLQCSPHPEVQHTSRAGNYPLPPVLDGKMRHLVVSSPHLEAEYWLQVFTLEEHLVA